MSFEGDPQRQPLIKHEFKQIAHRILTEEVFGEEAVRVRHDKKLRWMGSAEIFGTRLNADLRFTGELDDKFWLPEATFECDGMSFYCPEESTVPSDDAYAIAILDQFAAVIDHPHMVCIGTFAGKAKKTPVVETPKEEIKVTDKRRRSHSDLDVSHLR